MTDADLNLNLARDLREIQRLAEMLEDQVYHHANDRELPGGDAMVALAPVANLEAWQHKLDTAERMWLAGEGPEPFSDDSDEWEPPLQLLLFWSELWRMDLDAEIDFRPTLQTESAFLAGCLQWAWHNEPRFDLYAADVAKTRRILENVLRDGERQQSGAPCLNCRRNLLRNTDPKTGGLTDDWHCPGCHRQYTTEQYSNAVRAAYESLQIEDIDEQGTWATVQKAANEVKRSPRTVKTWMREGLVRRACLLLGRRDVVSLDDVQREADTRQRRSRTPGEPTYSGLHQRIRREQGQANGYPCVDCGEPAQQWSYKHTGTDLRLSDLGSPYTLDPRDYEPRCTPCHRKFDMRNARSA